MVGTSEQVEGVSQWRWAQVSKGPLRDMSNETFIGFRARWLRRKPTCCQVEEMRHHLAFGGENKKPSECWGATAWMDQGAPWCSGWGHACVLHPCSPVSRSWVAFCLTLGDLVPGELVHARPSFSTAWGTRRITDAGGASGVSAPSLTFWTSAPSLLQA